MHKWRRNREVGQRKSVLRNPLPASEMLIEDLRGSVEQRFAASDLGQIGPARSSGKLLGDPFSTDDAHRWSEVVRRPEQPSINVSTVPPGKWLELAAQSPAD